MVRMHVYLLEVCGRRLEHLHVRETDGGITCQSDPELATASCVIELVFTRRLVEHVRRCVAAEQPGGSNFNGRQQPEDPWREPV